MSDGNPIKITPYLSTATAPHGWKVVAELEKGDDFTVFGDYLVISNPNKPPRLVPLPAPELPPPPDSA